MPSGCCRRHDGQPRGTAERDVPLLLEPEEVGVEVEGLRLVVDEDARDIDPHSNTPFSLGSGQRSRDLLERRAVEVVELVPAVAFDRHHEAGALEHVEMLRDRLARRVDPVLHQQARTELEQRLTIALGQLIEDGPPGWIGKGLEDVQAPMIGKSPLACQLEDVDLRLGRCLIEAGSQWTTSPASTPGGP